MSNIKRFSNVELLCTILASSSTNHPYKEIESLGDSISSRSSCGVVEAYLGSNTQSDDDLQYQMEMERQQQILCLAYNQISKQTLPRRTSVVIALKVTSACRMITSL